MRQFPTILRVPGVLIATSLALGTSAALIFGEASPACADAQTSVRQTIIAPFGELRLGMTEDEAVTLFGRPAEELPGRGVTLRSITRAANDRVYRVLLTKRGTVYSIRSTEWSAQDRQAGEQSLDQRFLMYLDAYGGVGQDQVEEKDGRLIFRRWSEDRGYLVEVRLGCALTQLTVELTDDRILTRDGGTPIDDRVLDQNFRHANECVF
ncbi:hypothetical protein [Bradyrhizobium sp. SRS-191]|uniref:hypothetical protein n=1 Tax=Bradyrhizobium sp. SRS-191 TaxID=2962606 RepID=UPI00211EDC3A|nr:hypothetical protein [Bradyrhizobium sp. SRS-191]